MENKIKRRNILLLAILVCIGIAAMYLPSFLNGKYFVGGGDVKTQWFPFYILNRRTTISALKSGGWPFYSFVLFLGNNIWSSKTSYGLFDIYNLLSYFLDSNYFVIYDLLTFVKILVSALSMYLLIKTIYRNDKSALIAGLCYGLGSFSLYFTSQPGFLSFYSLAPFYLLAMEHYLQRGGKLLFIFMVFILLLGNYYLFYALSLLSPLYFLYRYYNLHGSFKGVVAQTLILIFYYLVGVLLSGIVILPAFFYVLNNERVGEVCKLATYNDLKLYLHLLISSLVPNHTYIYGNNVFDFTAHTFKEVCLYSGSLIALLVPQFLTDKNKKFALSTAILYLLLILILFSPFAGSVLNGFAEPCFRWLFFLEIINIIVAAAYLSSLEKINRHNLLLTASVEILLIAGCFFKAISLEGAKLSDYVPQLAIFVTVMAFMLVNVWSYLQGERFLLSLLFAELLLFSLIQGFRTQNDAISKTELDAVTNVLADSDDPDYLNYYLESLDAHNSQEFYRVYVPYDSLYWSFSHDLAAIYNFRGLMTYDSTYAQSFNKMRKIDYDGVVDTIDWEFNIQNPDIISFLSTKYAIVTKTEEIPFRNYEIVADNYRGSLIVAENQDYRPIGVSYDTAITYEEVQNDSSKLLETVISDHDVTAYLGDNGSALYNVAAYQNIFTAEIDCVKPSFVVTGIPYEAGWRLRVNGEDGELIECNGGFNGFAVPAGHSQIEMVFIPYGVKAGALLSAIGTMIYLGLIIIEIRKRRIK